MVGKQLLLHCVDELPLAALVQVMQQPLVLLPQPLLAVDEVARHRQVRD